MKSSVKLSAILMILLVSGCAASQAGPQRPWRVEVTTSGGITGRGAGDYAIDSDGKATAKLFDGRTCSFTAPVERIEALLAAARPREWKESYVPENNCCDRIEYILTYDEAGRATTTKWIDDPLPMPADLVALSRTIIGGDATSVRMLASERCR